MPGSCTHLETIAAVTPSREGCEDCLRTGGQWPHLRLCMHVGLRLEGDEAARADRLAEVFTVDGCTVVEGVDVAELSTDGRLARVTGFWGELPAR